ncbi:DUF4350 domain-containing protein [Pseudolysinimonas yzui]|uniref:Membrane protein n=1 Tax=Pseudolysinimonas yzui TaxID=2708254 RepID=A0A8J3GQH7_9MICO|nr:DUF4350 domain-containing protein [Pseudolysinimonas yzui]GHF15712.1 membrane protein [Pseudolysinimonas yzui]
MSVAAPPAPPTPAAPPRRTLRGVLIGVSLAVVFLLVAVIVYAVTRPQQREVDYLSPTSGSPYGSRALVNVLRDQGVDVEQATTLAEVRAVDSDPAETTLVLYDYYLVLGSDQRRELFEIADRIVVLDPLDAELDDFAPGVLHAGDDLGDTFPADCDLPAAEKAEAVSAAPYLYDIAEADAEVTGCFSVGDGLYSVVHTRTRGSEVTVVGLSPAFTNGEILKAGNAAFALNLLGENETLIWYRPDLSELESGEIPTAVSLTPPWVTPLVLLLVLLGLAAAIWRGRRLGPLVAERLPVVVRANETMEGRARLYERAGAREHALDSLRIGTIARLAVWCGLPRRATVDEVVDAVAALTGRDRDTLAHLLVDRIPAGDGALVELSDELLVLEAEVTRVVRGR